MYGTGIAIGVGTESGSCMGLLFFFDTKKMEVVFWFLMLFIQHYDQKKMMDRFLCQTVLCGTTGDAKELGLAI